MAKTKKKCCNKIIKKGKCCKSCPLYDASKVEKKKKSAKKKKEKKKQKKKANTGKR